MVTVVSYLLTALACVLAVPVGIIFIEVVAALTLRRHDSLAELGNSRPRVAIIVPAHNESRGLLPTLRDIKSQVGPKDCLLVVADNCTDDTATVAAEAGAEVIERVDRERRGKGHALAAGVRKLALDPPDVVIVIDADCRVAPGTIDMLAAACVSSRLPVQGLDLMLAPDETSTNYLVAEFAWRMKNWVRPLGLKALGLSCQLMGTGMGFPWATITSVDLASSSIVEDMKLGLDLALKGTPPQFCPSARVTSVFPSSAEAAQSQRRRWEHGHLGIIFGTVPRALISAVARANLQAFVLAIDTLVPPLALLALLVTSMLAITGLATMFGIAPTAFFVCAGSFGALVLVVSLCWLTHGRDVFPLRNILSLVPYIVGKLPIYRQLFSRRSDSQWVRTDRRGP
jgi:cellulose synthase/poly-beta-1,6-N-acetylglucosamine synthase-like glycosyltransferase